MLERGVETAEDAVCGECREKLLPAKSAKKGSEARKEDKSTPRRGRGERRKWNEQARRRMGRNAMFRPVVKSANTKSFDCVRLPLTSLRITEGKSSGAFDSLKMI